MLLKKLGKIVLITLSALSIISCDEIPDNTPYLISPNNQNLCPKYKLVDKQRLLYQFDAWRPCGDVVSGWGFPPGQFEAVLAWARNKTNCQNPQTQDEHEAGQK